MPGVSPDLNFHFHEITLRNRDNFSIRSSIRAREESGESGGKVRHAGGALGAEIRASVLRACFTTRNLHARVRACVHAHAR